MFYTFTLYITIYLTHCMYKIHWNLILHTNLYDALESFHPSLWTHFTVPVHVPVFGLHVAVHVFTICFADDLCSLILSCTNNHTEISTYCNRR